MLALTLGVLGCHTANPDYNPSDDMGGTASGAMTTTPDGGGNISDFTLTDAATSNAATTTATTHAATGDDDTDDTDDLAGECPDNGPLGSDALRRTWWLCEYGQDGQPPPDGCVILDNDGIRLESETKGNGLFRFTWFGAPMDDCIGSPMPRCFHCAHPDVPELSGSLWGQWSFESAQAGAIQIAVAAGDNSCTALLSWQLVPGESYVRVEPVGGGTACGLIGGQGPGVPAQAHGSCARSRTDPRGVTDSRSPQRCLRNARRRRTLTNYAIGGALLPPWDTASRPPASMREWLQSLTAPRTPCCGPGWRSWSATRWWGWCSAAGPARAVLRPRVSPRHLRRPSAPRDGRASGPCTPPGLRLGSPALFRGRSSAGRAVRSQCTGQGFDPPRLHPNLPSRPRVLPLIMVSAGSRPSPG